MSSNLNNIHNVNPPNSGSSSSSSGVPGGGHFQQNLHHHQQNVHGTGGGPQQGASGLSGKESTKSFNDRFKAFFKGLAKGPTAGSGAGASGGISAGGYANFKLNSDPACVLLTPELLEDLSIAQPLPTRLRALQCLTESVRSKRIEPHTVEKLWTQTSDLFSSSDINTRHTCFLAFTTIIQANFEKPGFLRAKLFSFLKGHNKSEDTYHRFQLLKALCENGRDLSYFEEKVGPFLLDWVDSGEICGSSQVVSVEEFMVLLTNVVKFNSSFLDDDVLGGFIQHSCIAALTASQVPDTLSCITLLNTVVMYAIIPPDSLQSVIATLCRTVNVDSLCLHSWKVMRNLLGTPLGHSGLFMLIQFMNTDLPAGITSSGINGINGSGNNENEMNSVIRGAVFYTGVALWGGGNRVVRSLTRGASVGGGGGGIVGVVLGAYEKTLTRSNSLITYEVLLRVQDLIRHSADSLQVIGWDLVLEIMRKIIDYSKQQEYQASLPLPVDATTADEKAHQQQLRNNKLLLSQIHETLDLVENILPTKTFCGSVNKYWEQIVEPVCHSRPVPSIESLLKHKHTILLNSSTTSFLANLVQFTLLHFQRETRVSLRLQALSLVQKICLLNQDTMEESLLDNVILPNLKNVELEANSSVRQHCVQFIVEFLMDSRSKKGHDLLHFVEKVVNRPFELEKAVPSSQCQIYNEDDVQDILVGVSGIIRIFQRKIYSLPSSIAVTAFKILVRHLEKHYKIKGNCLENCSTIRYLIFECFFRIRANALYHLGFPNGAGLIEAYSSYLAVDHRDPREGGGGGEHMDSVYSYAHSGPGVSPPILQVHQTSQQTQEKQGAPLVTYISLTAACKQVIGCLKKERDWKILELVLRQLPNVMENKALILSKHGNDVDILASHLCSMVKDPPMFSSTPVSSSASVSFRNTPQRFSRSDFQSCVFPALIALVSYHSSLDTKIQQQIVKCLEHGLVSSSSRICISALTTCTLEMKQIMHKLIPDILLRLTKITAKPNIAIHILEFLSTLIHLPTVFASFVQDQYMSIFAVCVNYTNPFKFNPYVVSLAHHVIALWFLKCRLSYRKAFVSYIIKNLEANVWAPFLEVTEKAQVVNEDSSNRKRSSSLTDQSNRKRERIVSGQNGGPGLSRQASCQPVDIGLIQFHQELTETCVDLMARYAFADCSPLPTRFESAGFLTQHGGNVQSWMIDNRIITITTSGCTQRELRDGLCDRCYLQCKQPQPERRSLLVGQHSFDEQDAKESSTLWEEDGRRRSGRGVKRSNTISGSGSYSGVGAFRRRHRSALVQKDQQQEELQQEDQQEQQEDQNQSQQQEDQQQQQEDQKQQHHDDLHLEHKLSADLAGGKDEGWRTEKKDGGGLQICMCWCQGWAEILIRRPTGNTSWMMRVQNLIGGGGSGWVHGMGEDDRLVNNLCAMYVKDIVESAKRETVDRDGEEGSCGDRMEETGDGSDHVDHQESSQQVSLSATGSGESIADGCPLNNEEEHAGPVDGQRSPTEEESKKQPVKRSNSSPEMAKWFPGTRPEGIAEKDEAGNNAQKQNISTTYLSSCDPIPEETSRKSESDEGPMPVTQKSVSASSSPPPTPDPQQDMLTLTPLKRDRTITISVMTPARRNNATPVVRRIVNAGPGDILRAGGISGGYGVLGESVVPGESGVPGGSGATGGIDPGIRSGISPSFIFLQLCGQGIFGNDTTSKPLLLPSNESTTTSLKVLDYIPPYETHKIGVIYVGPGQAKNEIAILQNSHGSLRYKDFLQGLGTLIKLNEVDPQKTFLGGLDGKGMDDGQFGCIWTDDVMQVIFHVATLMPTKIGADPNCNGKKRHIGNDFVAIVYNNSEEEFDIETIKCQFLYACVIIQPLDHRINRVFVKAKPNLSEQIGQTDVNVKIVSDRNLPIMARQLALHSNLASVIYRKLSLNSEPYATNWLGRLRAIKRLRARLFPQSATGGGAPGSTSGLSSSSQELGDSLGGIGVAGGIGSTGNIGGPGGSGGALPKGMTSFGVDDFTEYA